MRKILMLFTVAVALVLLMPQLASADNVFDVTTPATLQMATINVDLTSDDVLTCAHLVTVALISDTTRNTRSAVEVKYIFNDRTVLTGLVNTRPMTDTTAAITRTTWRHDTLRS
jgi:hypothetical protein